MSHYDETKVLITGGGGRLGRACRIIFPNAQYPRSHTLNVKNRDQVFDYFRAHPVETVIHLAAMAGIDLCEKDKHEAYDVNVNGVRHMLEGALAAGVQHFIYLSTACVFPGTDDQNMEDEDSLPYPKHYYGLTKYIAEEILRSYPTGKMKVTVARTNFTTMPWEYPKAFVDRFGTYLFAQGVAKGLKDIALARPDHPIIHLCGERKLSMYEYAVLGGSKVEKLTLAEHKGPPLTVNMCMTTKYWKKYRIEDSDFHDS